MKTEEKSNSPTPQSRRGRRRRLRSLENVRQFVAHVLRGVEAGGNTTDPDRARVLIHGAQVLAGLIKDIDVTQQLADLQAEVDDLKSTYLYRPMTAYSSTLEECRASGGAEQPSYLIDVTQLETR